MKKDFLASSFFGAYEKMRITHVGTVVLVSGRVRNNAPPPDEDPLLEEHLANVQAGLEVACVEMQNDCMEAQGIDDDAYFLVIP